MSAVQQQEQVESLAFEDKWTLLIYQAGDNNLNEECIYSLKEMKKVGTWGPGKANQHGPSLLNVIVQFDPAGRANPTRRFKIRGRGDDGTVASDEILRFGEVDTGDQENLLDFLCESINGDPNRHFMVILGGHGAGVSEGFFLKDDERPLSSIPNSFPVTMLKEVFNSSRLKGVLKGRKIDILGFDACMMSMVEICYELRDINTLDLVLASEGFTLNSGWPVERIMQTIKNCVGIPSEALGRSVIKHYIEYYGDYVLGGVSVDQTLVRLGSVKRLKQEIDKLALKMISEFHQENSRAVQNFLATENDMQGEGYYSESGRPFQDAVLLAHWAAQSYNGEQCVDLYDFSDLLQKRLPEAQRHDRQSLWWACQGVKDALRGTTDPLIVKSCYRGASFQYSFGASLYFPWGDYDFAPSYAKLDFAEDSEWTNFLKLYLKATKRRPRRGVQFERMSENTRFTPPTDRGPSGKIYSMRNPPTTFFKLPC